MRAVAKHGFVSAACNLARGMQDATSHLSRRRYADLLQTKLERHGASAFLVSTPSTPGYLVEYLTTPAACLVGACLLSAGSAAGEHWLDRRRVWRGQSHEHQGDACVRQCHPRRQARSMAARARARRTEGSELS